MFFHVLVFFIFQVIGAVGVATFGQKRKFGYWGYFFASLLLTPLIGILLVIASDDPVDKNAKSNQPTEK